MPLHGASLPSASTNQPHRSLRRVAVIATAALAIVAAAIVAVAASSPRQTAAAGPTILVSPAAVSSGVGQDVNIDIDVADIATPGLGGYVVVMRWDPAVLSLTSLSDSGWVTSGGLIVLCSAPTIDNTGGSAELDCTPFPFPPGDGVTTTAPHPIANAVFHTKSIGTTAIDLAPAPTPSSLLDPAANEITPLTITNGTVTVVLSVGGEAREPDQASLPVRGDGGRGGELRYGAIIAVALAAAAAASWRFARRLRNRGSSA